MFNRLTATPWHIASWAIIGLIIGYTAVVLTSNQNALADSYVCIQGEHKQ